MHLSRFFALLTVMLLGTAGLARAEVSSALIKPLFEPNMSLADLEKAAAAGAKAGVPAQTIGEAKLVWGLRHQDNAFLERTLPELESAAQDFKKEDSASMSSKEDFLALINYIKALVAMKQGSEADFKKFITEAFWLSPQQAQLFAQTITKQRVDQKMASIKLDMTAPITDSKGESTTLAAQLGKNKAILLDFWASWCGPCIEGLPTLKKRAAYLSGHGIVVCGMNTESDEAAAEKVRVEKQMNLPWLVEPKEHPLTDPLEITTIPHVVLISPAGKVLYNGFPDDSGLWTALKGVDASIEPLKEE
jgi:thiol-disulfide isomerase/thioredoxin